MGRDRNVWDDLASSPEEADDLSARSDIMIELTSLFAERRAEEVAVAYGIDMVVVADIRAGRIDRLPLTLLRVLKGAVAATPSD